MINPKPRRRCYKFPKDLKRLSWSCQWSCSWTFQSSMSYHYPDFCHERFIIVSNLNDKSETTSDKYETKSDKYETKQRSKGPDGVKLITDTLHQRFSFRHHRFIIFQTLITNPKLLQSSTFQTLMRKPKLTRRWNNAPNGLKGLC